MLHSIEHPDSFVLIEIEGCQAETMRVIGKAEEYVRKNKIAKGQIWCVYDKDSFPASDVNGVVQRAEVLNQKNPDVQYFAAWSNECIELPALDFHHSSEFQICYPYSSHTSQFLALEIFHLKIFYTPTDGYLLCNMQNAA